jgi:hypothetical protein
MTPLAASQLPEGGKTPLTASTSQRQELSAIQRQATPTSQDFRTPLASRLRRTPSSQGGVRRKTTTARLFENIIDPDTHITEEEEEDEKETLEMSQVVWDTVETSPVEKTTSPAPSRSSGSSTTTNLLNASLWGPEDDDADFLKQLEW